MVTTSGITRQIPYWVVEHDKLYPNCVETMIRDGFFNCCGHVTPKIWYEIKTDVIIRLPSEPDPIIIQDKSAGYLIKESGQGYGKSALLESKT